jgi:hypothetical protein
MGADAEAPLDDEAYLRKFVDFLGTQPAGQDLDLGGVAPGMRRDELGISSLNVIMLVMAYLKKNGAPGVRFSPRWVARLENVDGILTVLREIDETALAKATTTT